MSGGRGAGEEGRPDAPSRTATGVAIGAISPSARSLANVGRCPSSCPFPDEATIGRVNRDHYQLGFRHSRDAATADAVIGAGAERFGPPP